MRWYKEAQDEEGWKRVGLRGGEARARKEGWRLFVVWPCQ